MTITIEEATAGVAAFTTVTGEWDRPRYIAKAKELARNGGRRRHDRKANDRLVIAAAFLLAAASV